MLTLNVTLKTKHSCGLRKKCQVYSSVCIRSKGQNVTGKLERSAGQDHPYTFRCAVNGLPLVVPLGFDIDVVVLAVGGVGGGVGGAVFVHRQLAV